MKTGAAVIGFVLCGAIGLGVGHQLGKSGSKSAENPSVAAKTAPAGGEKGAEGESERVKVPVGESPAKGPADALVTIVEFSDFQCPFCSRVVPTLKQIHETYGDQVRVVFKHNPLPFHPNATPAAEYAVAATEQGKFWEMHDKLFENQQTLEKDKLEEYAQAVGLDMNKLHDSLNSGKGKAVIQQDLALGAKVGARGTPNFFINGIQLTGARPFPDFKRVIDEQLAVAKKLTDSGTPKAQVYEKLMASARETAPQPKPQEQPQQPPATRQKVELVSSSPIRGGKSPLVTIVEWSDFECPFCGRVTPTLKQIESEYGDKVAVHFRHQPLPFHQKALPAAKAAVAAQKQGKFWEMHDKLFENQQTMGPETFEKFAKEIGLNVAKFKKDMEDPETMKIISTDQADGAKYGARGTPSFFINGVPLRGAQPYPAFKAAIDKELAIAEKYLKDGTSKSALYQTILDKEAGKEVAAAPQPQQPQAPEAPAAPVKIDVGHAPIQGSKDAPIKLVLFSDFECPFCGRVNPSIEQVKQEYKGKVSIAFKHYPLPFHQHAQLAAIASLAAHKQGKFWEMHDKLFANQQKLERDDLISYAQAIGLDVNKFKKDLDDPALAAWVKADTEEGSRVGVNGTPATFINGRLVSGAQPYQAFKAIIDQELSKS